MPQWYLAVHKKAEQNETPTIMATASLQRDEWSLQVRIPDMHNTSTMTTIVDASRLRRSQPNRARMSLANVALDAIHKNGTTRTTSWGAHVQLSCQSRSATPPKLCDRELQEVLEQVKNTQSDAMQFQIWKSSFESHECKQ